MNLLFILLVLPNQITFFFPIIYVSPDIQSLLNCLSFGSYSINFYLILATNSLFRSEFFTMLKINKKKNKSNINLHVRQPINRTN